MCKHKYCYLFRLYCFMRESSLCSQGNVGEFLLVDKRHINMGGTECNKIGAGISAYHMLRHKCGLTSQP